MLGLWDSLLHRLWQRVGAPGMQCRGPHVEPGDQITVQFVGARGPIERDGVVNVVIGSIDGPQVTRIVLRDPS